MLVARRTLTTAALVAITLGACGDGDGGTGRDRATAPDPEQVADDLSRLELEQAIADRLQDLIREENLPYVTTYDPYSRTTEEDASGTGLPIGTWLQMGLSVPVEPNEDHPNEPDLFLRKPLDVYAAAVRPYIDAMDFVVVYSLAWEPFDVSSLSLVIHPEQMRAYLNGDITIDQFASKVTAYGPDTCFSRSISRSSTPDHGLQGPAPSRSIREIDVNDQGPRPPTQRRTP